MSLDPWQDHRRLGMLQEVTMGEHISTTIWHGSGGIEAWHPPPTEVDSGRYDTAADVWVVVLAGGWGTRLQQFIRHITGSDRPKQFCRIVGTRSMLRHTWDRARQFVPADRMATAITAGQERYLNEEKAAGVPGHVLVQPANKDTGPGLLLPLLWVAQRSPEATVVVFPADHFIWEEERFLTHVRAAVRSSQSFPDRLVILGVEADGPEQSYGWIAPGSPRNGGTGMELYQVKRFWEKPDRETAARLFASGYLWNTFVLAGRLQAFMRAAREALPDTLAPLSAAAAFLGTRYEAEALAATYRRLRPTNFSRTLLVGQPEALLTMPVRGVYWSDWGDPQRILRTLRRFDKRPEWLRVYARTFAQGAEEAAARS
jgi:mannose-1-phosphate guanylyltransferase